MPNAIIVIDLNGAIQEITQEAEALFGITYSQLPEVCNLSTFFSLCNVKMFNPELLDVHTRNNFDSIESDLSFEDGTRRRILWVINPLRDDRGSHVGVVICGTELLNGKEPHSELNDSVSMYRSLFDNFPERVYMKDESLRYIYCNTHFAADYSLTPSDIIGKKDSDFFPPDRNRPDDINDLDIISSGCPQRTEVKMRINGKEYWMQLLRYPFQSQSAKEEGVIGIYRDITSEKKMREKDVLQKTQAAQADKTASLEILVAGVAHQINNPNQYIFSSLQILIHAWRDMQEMVESGGISTDRKVAGLKYEDFKEELPKIMMRMKNGSEKISGVIKDLRDYAISKPKQNFELININEVLNSAIKFSQYLINSKTNRFHLTLSNDLPEIYGKRHILEHAFIALILNACQALTSRDQSITITSRFNDISNYVEISVTDEGPRFEDENMNHTKSPSLSKIATSQKIDFENENTENVIKEHDGIIEYKSIVGDGRMVSVSLPVHDNKRAIHA